MIEMMGFRIPKGRLRQGVAALLSFALLGWLDACASAGAVRLETSAPQGSVLAWPAPPEAPRVSLVRSFSSARDLGFRRSFLGRVFDFVRGEGPFNQLQHPYGIAVTDDEVVYVVDSAAKGVHAFDLPRGKYDFYTGRDFENPIAVAVGPDGRIYVTDSEAAVVVILKPNGDEESRVSGFVRPTGIAVSETTSELVVIDTGAHEVRVLTLDGTPIRTFGSRGIERGELNFPTQVAVGPEGQIYVSDSMNFRVQVFQPDGTYLREFGRLGDAVGEFARPKGLGVDDQGRAFVVEGLYDVVNIFDSTGRLLLNVGGPGSSEGSFWLATGLAVDGRGRIFVADTYNGRVQVFQVLAEQGP